MYDRIGRVCVVCTAVLVVGGCVTDGASPSDFIVRDSAGVRIVEYAGTPQPTHSITLSAEPLFRHGHREGDYQFQTAWTGSLQPDGGAVSGDARNNEVVVIGPDGQLRAVLARSGQGPSEVQRLLSVIVLGQDTVFVEDDGNGKFMIFEDGALARTVSTAGDYSINQALRTREVDSSGRLLMTTSSFRPGFEEAWLQGHMVIFDMDDAVADTIASYDMVPSSASPPQGSANPFAPNGVVAASGGSFVYGRADTPELLWRGPDGAVRQILRWNPERAYPTDEHWETFAEQIRASMPRANPGRSDAQMEAMIERALDRWEVMADEALPLFVMANGDGTGGLWLVPFVAGFSPTAIPSYHVIAPDGVWLGTIDSPPRFMVLDVADGRVLGKVLDEFDVESVAVYEISITPLGS